MKVMTTNGETNILFTEQQGTVFSSPGNRFNVIFKQDKKRILFPLKVASGECYVCDSAASTQQYVFVGNNVIKTILVHS